MTMASQRRTKVRGSLSWAFLLCFPVFTYGEGFICDNIDCSDNTQEALILFDRGISGTLPDELFSFDALQIMNLLNNEISGTILPLSQAPLIEMHLDFNKFSGTIPPDVIVPTLENLQVSGNELSGTIPIDVPEAPPLQFLVLHANEISGTLPPEVMDLPLIGLDLGQNSISGTIPPQVGKLSQLLFLDFSDMMLSGTIPASFINVPASTCLLSGNPELGCVEGPVEPVSFCSAAAAAVPCRPPPSPAPALPAPSPPAVPPPLEQVVTFDVNCVDRNVGDDNVGRRLQQSGRPLSVESVFGYVSSVMPQGVADRDITVTAVRRGRGRRLQAGAGAGAGHGGEEGRRLQTSDPCEFTYVVEVFVRGEVSSGEILEVVASPSFETGLDTFITEPVGVENVRTEEALVPSPFAPPSSPPPLEEVVQIDIDCASTPDRRRLQAGEPLSVDSVFAYVSSRMPDGVADRDIVVTAVRGGRGRRLQENEEQKRRLQGSDACGFTHLVDIFVRGEVSTDEILAVVTAPAFEVGLDEFISEPVLVTAVATAIVPVPSPSAPPSAPLVEEVVQVDIAEIDSNGRRRLQDGEPLSVDSVFAYVSTTMPEGVADRDIVVSAVRGGRGRRLQEGEYEGRRLQGPDDLVYLADIFVRGTVSSAEIFRIVSSPAWEVGLDAFIAESVGVLSVSVQLVPVPAPFLPPSAPSSASEYVCFDLNCRECGAAADNCAVGSACFTERCDQGLGSSTKSECEQACTPLPGRARKDPHLYLPHGGRADFRGAHNATFAMLSAKDVAFNVKVLGADFNWAKRIVHGTKMAAAYWVVRTSTGRLIKVEYDCASTLGGVVRESGQRDIYVKKMESPLRIDNVRIAMIESKKLVVTVDGKWTLSASVSPFPFGNLAANKNKKLLDIEIEPLYDADSDVVAPHGIIGQAYDGDDIGIHGKLDSRHGNETTTTAQAEGAIEGMWEEYIVSSPFSTEFKYSRFDATAAKPRDVSALTGVKTAWRSVKKQTISAAKTLEVALATQ